ncbi:DUF420 domain-containing protein [Anaerobacillus isosaccharinicus]|uniref:DUF420 domain-containing protein n=2 Tax=Anaerobacillus isosaccharinicus TaxID=1532552 RepID=A0A1S2KXB5_9BACI|nr:DUF420 domain-containing protein [Anaerobacillus isosaccharinicus]
MKDRKVRNYTPAIIILTIVINGLVILLSGMPRLEIDPGFDVKILPLINAILNSFTFLFLVGALWAIKKKNISLHTKFIYAAFTTTALFLVTYVGHHALSEATTYGGEGILKSIYYFILITHIFLAAAIVPLALITLARGLNRQDEKHKKIARWTMPLWLYVALTGVLVYLLISPYY